jgi:hypothetical protein
MVLRYLLRYSIQLGDPLPYNLAFVQNKAREQAEMRGHLLGVFKRQTSDIATAECMRCTLPAIASTLTRENDVTGEATRTVCKNRTTAGLL